jgi:hypothetical protein
MTLPLTVPPDCSPGQPPLECSHVGLESCQNQQLDRSLFVGLTETMR